MPGTVMTLLREGTKAQHEHAESRPLELALVQGSISAPAYRSYLQQRLWIHRELDARTREVTSGDARFAGLQMDGLWQVPNLEQDLQHLKADAGQPLADTTEFLNELKTAQEACPVSVLGAYYVFEGSKNGARFIANSIRKAFGMEQDGCRYLDPHGSQQRTLWKAFKEQMDAVDLTSGEEQAMLVLAQRTFDAVAAIDDAVAAACQAVAVD